MLSCREMAEQVTPLLEGELPWHARLRCRWHLVSCQNCRAYLEQMKMTAGVVGRLPRELPSEALRDALLPRFRSAFPRKPSRRVHDARLGWGIAVGLSLVAMVVVVALTSAQIAAPREVVSDCALAELLGALVPTLPLVWTGLRRGAPRAAGVWAGCAAAGAFLVFLGLRYACPWSDALNHVLPHHVGGLLVGIAAAAALSRIPKLRTV